MVSIPKEKWEVITAEDLENARPEIQPGDIVIVNTGWHRYYGDNRKYFVYSPGTYKEAGEWFASEGSRASGSTARRSTIRSARRSARSPNGPLIPGLLEEYKEHTGREAAEDFPLWEPCHRALLGNGIVGFENVGGEIDAVTGKRVTFAAFPGAGRRATAASSGWSRCSTRPASTASRRGAAD